MSPVRICLWAAALSAGITAAAQAAPAQMQAIVETARGGPEVLKLQSIPVLEPKATQIRIKVYAAAVNPVDRYGREPRVRDPNVPHRQVIPGFDVAGVIEAVGPGVTQFKVGDPVISMVAREPVVGLNGGYAEYVIANVVNTLPKPKNITYVEAAGLITVGATAVRTLDEIQAKPGQRIFVNGVSGGVGNSIAQIAKAWNIKVVGTAHPRNHAYLKSIGVDEVIDYTTTQFETVVKDVDAAIDAVSSDGANRSLGVVKKGGRVVAIAGPPDPAKCAAAGVYCEEEDRSKTDGARPNRLKVVADLAAEGKYVTRMDSTFPLAEAGAAQARNRANADGKVVLIVDPAMANTK